MTSLTTQQTFSLSPQNLTEAMQLAELMANSEMVPKDFRGKPGNVLVAVQMGAEVGLAPMQAIQNIGVINGRPCLWGDAIKAVILASPLCEKFEETFDEQSMTAWVTVKRKNHAERTVKFSQADAQAAGLWGKSGPWQQYPKRMLQMRARGFSARDEFADVLKGLSVAEEVQDYQIKDVTPVQEKKTELLPSNSEEWIRAVKAATRGELANVQAQRNISDENLTKLKTEAGLILAEEETNA